ncbi:probable G-protein coupled receptor Mth-like 1 isoform X2 [Macrobrachium nipponense]
MVLGLTKMTLLLLASLLLTWVRGSLEEAPVIRKCCAQDEFFDAITWHCVKANLEEELTLEHHIKNLLRDTSTNITYRTGRLSSCPVLEIEVMTPQSHAFLTDGRLQDLGFGVTYDHKHYCTELQASSPEELTNGTLVAEVCPRVKNCCNESQNDALSLDCHAHLGSTGHYVDQIHTFLNTPLISDTFSVENARSFRIVKSDKIFAYNNDGTMHLCDFSEKCFPVSSCCKEFFGEDSGAFICQNKFNKCCSSHEIWSDNGCVATKRKFRSSSHMTELMESYLPQTAQPNRSGKTCNTTFKSADKHILWWIDGEGTLSVQNNEGSLSTTNYCVEDYEDNTGAADSMVMLCLWDIAQILPEETLDHYSEGLPFGKCCPEGQYLNGNFSCISGEYDLDILNEPQFVAAKVTELIHTGFPKCKNLVENYISYDFGQQNKSDYAILVDDQTMGVNVIDDESGCNFTFEKLRNTDYCIDYFLGNTTRIQIFICSNMYRLSLKHQEKYIIIPTLMGVSCAALLYTAYVLLCSRVRRGIVTVKKINTLAGRILLSYVFSYFLAFMFMIIQQTAPLTNDGKVCPLIAGSVLFFMLAAFLWNTSICLEPLLLTLDVRVPENCRLLCHCLWGWGVPAIITAVALTLDHYRKHLDCSIVTPKIGLNSCLFSDDKARLLYLYTPMSISLLANVVFLISSKLARRIKLKQLEQAAHHIKNDDNHKSSEGQRPNAKPSLRQHSGLRKYENRNVWVDSTKLVFWAGSTWVLELVAFLIGYYKSIPGEKWYTYLWYLPIAINCLRGVGIFFIIVLTADVRKKLFKRLLITCPRIKTLRKAISSPSKTGNTVSSTSGKQSTSKDKTSSILEPETTVTKL